MAHRCCPHYGLTMLIFLMYYHLLVIDTRNCHRARAAGSWRVPQRVAGLPAKGARSPSFSSHSCARPPSKNLGDSADRRREGFHQELR